MIKWIIIAILLFIGIRRLIPTKGIHHIDVPEAKAMRGKGNIQWIDVRSPLEYAGQRDELFRNIPLNKLKKESPNLNKEAPVVLICQSGV
ncbi:MAG TPA: rhodanese-like domain-containing protein, partial [Pseudogracilibacillus sp.]|nr:rhodanese-like domain-containing protein [Pseudogracilibacillus sp.]